MALFFFGFIIIFTFGLLNMMVAVVVEKTMSQARSLQDLDQKEIEFNVAQSIQNFQKAFHGSDMNRDGVLSREEVEAALLDHSALKDALSGMNIPTDDAMT